KGLGRNESGIAEALKPSLKFDKAGVGHNKADDLCFNWWDHVYKKAASNIIVENLEDGVEMKQIEDNSDLITTKKWKLKKKKKNRKQSSLPENKPLKYGIFMKSSVLTNHGEIKDETSQPYSDDDDGQDGDDDDDDEFPHRADLDETLLKACEGRTAHKGARHGLTASGKLMRLEAQENGVDIINLAVSEKKKKRKVHDDETSTIPNGKDVGREELLPERKKKKKKMNRSQSRNKLESEISQNVGNGDHIWEMWTFRGS
ncbi:putative G patch domain-containing protein 4, partial [Apostichopus japonicus]